MTEKAKYYQIEESEDSLVLNDRMAIQWKEIVLYPIPLTVFMLFLSDFNILIAVSFGVAFGFLYMVFRYFAWFAYKEFRIEKTNGNVFITRKLLNHTNSIELIDKEFDFESIRFDEQDRSGKTKHILQYVTYKTNDILVVKNDADRIYIESRLKALKKP